MWLEFNKNSLTAKEGNICRGENTGGKGFLDSFIHSAIFDHLIMKIYTEQYKPQLYEINLKIAT